jgi:hypothetical protein
MTVQICEWGWVLTSKGDCQNQVKSYFVGSQRRYVLQMHGLQGVLKLEGEEVDFPLQPVRKPLIS